MLHGEVRDLGRCAIRLDSGREGIVLSVFFEQAFRRFRAEHCGQLAPVGLDREPRNRNAGDNTLQNEAVRATVEVRVGLQGLSYETLSSTHY